ncbi:Ribonuclease D [Methylacidimicrobium sp. AP8]|uniref:ribonuclease D n=1 Tax=Methylacidimicrobium sp. AP8 TaxID=2730359 RepID=UPI0018C1A453|nr:ribonuclease D [Methylacidimicrobium sp. AP8]CAB4243902.1 Ribonuclease D [Methylacidimicrobium sp. AP8]
MTFRKFLLGRSETTSRAAPQAVAWIDSVPELSAFSKKLRPGLPIAIDAESASFHHYQARLCVLSIRQGEVAAVVDTLRLDPAPLWEPLSRSPWILHGMDFDRRLLREAGAPDPPSVFDTMIAAQLCGLPAIGYAALVQRFFGVEIAKQSQKADWARRPLSPAMLDYAAQDVRYLESLQERLTGELDRLGRREWHRESCARLLRKTGEAAAEKSGAWRIRGWRDLPPEALPFLRSLWEWREEEAARRDLAPFRLVPPELLLRLAAWAAARRGPLPGRWLPRHLGEAERSRLAEALSHPKGTPEELLPPAKPRLRLTAEAKRRLEALTATRSRLAARLGIDPGVLAPKPILLDLAQDPQGAPERLVAEGRWCRWQRDLFVGV